jgi:NADPH-dependent 2,4-dienoyl-CoA reductase/sulfur reductase-like enzyme
MQAALLAAKRGHQVSLYEKSAQLGGMLKLLDGMDFKYDLIRYRNYLVRQVEKTNIAVYLNTEATPEMIKKERPDAIIVAIGGEHFVPPIPGVESAMSSEQAHLNNEKIGQKVVIIGGGTAGCEMAVHLGKLGKEVVVVEMGEILMPTGIFTDRMHTIHFMDEYKVKYYTETKCKKITEQGIEVVNAENKEFFINADTVILSTGLKSKAKERDGFANTAFKVISVGDCVQIGTVINATRTAYDAVLSI